MCVMGFGFVEEPGISDCRRAVAGVGNRGEYNHIYDGELGVSPATSRGKAG